MSILFGKEVVLFPSISGSITLRGKPAANAEIKVRVYWKDEVGEEEVFHANTDGAFSIPEKTRKVRIPPLAEFVITQQVVVLYEGEEYTIWSKATMETDKYGGLDGEIRSVRCELTNDRKRQQNFNGLFSTSCELEIVK